MVDPHSDPIPGIVKCGRASETDDGVFGGGVGGRLEQGPEPCSACNGDDGAAARTATWSARVSVVRVVKSCILTAPAPA